ncbi:MAG: hypothetical protein M1812_006870 [Candelaria pacifica]|nr:MAG: hypothetical protein M1812_006870 [Candelaria pacifica]
MAGTPIGTGLPKPSFAKVAALAASKDPSRQISIGPEGPLPIASSTPSKDTVPPTLPLAKPEIAARSDQAGSSVENGVVAIENGLKGVDQAMKALRLKDGVSSPAQRSLDEHNSDAIPAQSGVVFGTHQLHSSASDLLAKPPSLDGKSVTSGTTFALDEKESLRPDDSASVVAAEEEDLFSPPGSGAASSRVGSEAGARAFRDQFYEISDRMGPVAQRIPIPPRTNDISAQAPISLTNSISHAPGVVQPSLPGLETFQGTGAPYGFAQQAPDEKLLEALESPKDRLFLLRLEQDVIDFVKDPKKPDTLDLPPCNSFYRLLAHKLADYYFLTHFVDNAVNAVRLFRTPFCRLPPLLTSLSNPPTSGNTPPPATAFKIMQRGGLKKATRRPYAEGNTAVSSEAPSKATSENGGNSSEEDENGVVSATGSASAKDKATLTREEREAKYKAARERIFKGFEESESGEVAGGDEDQKDVSRSSSNAGKKKNKKHKIPKDDGFEARSQFSAYYPSMQYSMAAYSGAPSSGAFYSPFSATSSSAGGHMVGTHSGYQQQFTSPFLQLGQSEPVSGYPMQAQHYYPGSANGSGGQPLSLGYDMNYGQSIESQRGGSMFSPANNMPQQAPITPPPPVSTHGHFASPISHHTNRQWQPAPHQNPYQTRGTQLAQSQVQSVDMHQYQPPAGMPPQTNYPYGQLPSVGSADYGQHPLPGSYNRQMFNPQTQSFVPSNGYTGLSGSRPNSQHYPSSMASPPLNYYSGNQASLRLQSNAPTSSRSSGYSSPQSGQVNNGRYSTSVQENSYTGITTAANPQSNQSSLSKWGTPSHLPPKPPPPQAPPFVDSLRSLPSHAQATGGFSSSQHTLPPAPTGSQFRVPSASGAASLPVLDPGIRMVQRSSGGGS